MLLGISSASPADLRFLLVASSAKVLTMDRITSADSATTARNELSGLIERVAGGDHRAFSALYNRTAAKLYGICLRLLPSEAEAQDVMQEAYVTVWRKAGRFDPSKASPVTWLAVLARNKAIDRLRRSTASTEEMSAAADVEDESPSAFTIIAGAEDELRLRRCMEELDERARSFIRSAFLDGNSYRQLAERDDVPIGTMKSWIRRGLQRLRGCLEQ